ncbi:MAG: SH3 domain-containing protein [Bacteroidetes bacterium]|nr:MAG: SH3 domain-containing protein [Bacteroidota bacterium]
MNKGLEDILKRSTEINATIAPMNKMMKSYGLVDWGRISTTIPHLSGINSMLSKTLRGAGIFNLATTLPPDPVQRIIRGTMFGNPEWLKAITAVSANQHSISESLAKSLEGLGSLSRVSSKQADISRAIFGGWSQEMLKSSLTGLHSTLLGVNTKIAIKGLSRIEPGFWERFTQTTQEAAVITKELTETEYATKNDIAKLEAFIENKLAGFQQEISETFNKKSPSRFELMDFWVTVLSIILSIVAILQTCQLQNEKNPEAATHGQVIELKQFVGEKFRRVLENISVLAEVRINCNLRMKPTKKSKGFFRVSAGDTVNVLEGNHKWVRITIMDEDDSFPITGWVEKKYLVRLKQ